MKKNNNTKKILGAIISTLAFCSFFIFIISMIIYSQITYNDKMPWWACSFILLFFLLPIIGAIYNLILRIKEIKGGEEDEASKY